MSSNYTLRPWSLSDLDTLVVHANNANIANFMTDQFPHPYTKSTGKEFIEFANRDSPIHIFAIDVDGQAIGGMGIHPQSDIYRKNAELGYWLSETYWGKGIISKLIPQIVDFAFHTYDINRIFARPFASNLASQKVLEKNNFILEAKLENTIFKKNTYESELIYAIRRNDWK